MDPINKFALSGVWEHRKEIFALTTAAPIVVEGALLAHNIAQNPQCIKETFTSLKTRAIQSFTFREDQTRNENIARIAKNCFMILTALSCMGGAAYLSLTLLPSSMAICGAISAAFLVGKCFLNASHYKNELIRAFTAQDGESKHETRIKIAKNGLKAAAAVSVTVAGFAIGGYIGSILAQGAFWQVPKALPFQTRAVVFAEYALLSVLHAGLAAYNWVKGDKKSALFHLFASALGIIFPIFYMHNEMRLHHSFYGLALMAAPSRPLKMIGTIITLDSSLYFLQGWRGQIRHDYFYRENEFDFINILAKHFSTYFNTYSTAMMLENVNESLPKVVDAHGRADLV